MDDAAGVRGAKAANELGRVVQQPASHLCAHPHPWSAPDELEHERAECLTANIGNGQIADIFFFEVLACGDDTRKSAQSRKHCALVPEPSAAVTPEPIRGAMRTGLLEHAGSGGFRVMNIDRAQHTAGKSGTEHI